MERNPVLTGIALNLTQDKFFRVEVTQTARSAENQVHAILGRKFPKAPTENSN